MLKMKKKINKKSLECWFSIAANASQVLLLILAVFGYFYTVIPVYQKELLSEKISQQELKLNQLSELNIRYKDNISNYEKDLDELKTKIKDANQEIKTKTETLNTINRRINLLYKKNYAEALMIALLNRNASVEDDKDKFFENSKTEYIKENLPEFIVTAYQRLKRVVDDPWDIYGDGSPAPQNIIRSVNDDLSKILEKNKNELNSSLANQKDLLYRIKHKQLDEKVFKNFDKDYYYQWSLSEREKLLYIVNFINNKEKRRALHFIEEFSNLYK